MLIYFRIFFIFFFFFLEIPGITIREKCTDNMAFEIYDTLQNKTLIKKKMKVKKLKKNNKICSVIVCKIKKKKMK